MKELSMCRICLAADIRLITIAKHLQDMYEKLTALTFRKEDGRPLVVCYICHARLQNCYQLRASCLQGDELLTQMLNSNVLIQVSSTNSLRAVSVMQISLGHVPQKSSYCSDDNTELEQQYSKDTDKENQEQGSQKDDDIQNAQTLPENLFHYEISCDVMKNESDYVDTDTEDMTIGTKSDISIDENEWETCNNNPRSKPADNIVCPKIAKIVLQRMVHNETVISASSQPNESRLATHISIKTRSKRDGQEKESFKIAVPESVEKTIVRENPNVISKKHKATIAVDAKLKKPTRSKYSTKKEEVTKARDKVYSHKYKSNNLNKKNLRSNARVKREKLEIAVPAFVKDNPIVVNDKHKAIGKIDAKLKKPTRKIKKEDNKETKVKNEVRRQKSNGLNKKDLKLEGRIKREKYIYTGRKIFPCNVCNKYFSFNCQLKIHARTHTGDKPYSCDMCKKCFTTKTGLIEHIRSHTGETPYNCPVCDKCFKNHRNLKCHSRIHTGEKPYGCNICTKRFNQPSSLVVHNRTHTGEKPFSCDVCNKCFKYRRVLNGHMLKHTLPKV